MAQTPHSPGRISACVIHFLSTLSGTHVLIWSSLFPSYPTLCEYFFIALVVEEPFYKSPDCFQWELLQCRCIFNVFKDGRWVQHLPSWPSWFPSWSFFVCLFLKNIIMCWLSGKWLRMVRLALSLSHISCVTWARYPPLKLLIFYLIGLWLEWHLT